MKLYIGCDQGAFELKNELLKVLEDEFKNYEVKDMGIFTKESVDYPDIAKLVCDEVLKNDAKGILLCGTGIGISIAANKIKGIRCALCHETYTAKMARMHNDANVLAMGGRTTGIEIACEILRTYLNTEFAGDRHKRRVDKIMALEN